MPRISRLRPRDPPASGGITRATLRPARVRNAVDEPPRAGGAGRHRCTNWAICSSVARRSRSVRRGDRSADVHGQRHVPRPTFFPRVQARIVPLLRTYPQSRSGTPAVRVRRGGQPTAIVLERRGSTIARRSTPLTQPAGAGGAREGSTPPGWPPASPRTIARGRNRPVRAPRLDGVPIGSRSRSRCDATSCTFTGHDRGVGCESHAGETAGDLLPQSRRIDFRRPIWRTRPGARRRSMTGGDLRGLSPRLRCRSPPDTLRRSLLTIWNHTMLRRHGSLIAIRSYGPSRRGARNRSVPPAAR